MRHGDQRAVVHQAQHGRSEVPRDYVFKDDRLLLTMTPHMHLRGKAFRYEAVYPGRQEEVLLDVPRSTSTGRSLTNWPSPS